MGIGIAGGGAGSATNVNDSTIVNIPVAIGDQAYCGADIVKSVGGVEGGYVQAGSTNCGSFIPAKLNIQNIEGG